MNPTFDRLLKVKKAINIFENGSLEDQMKFCKEFIEKNSPSKPFIPEPPKPLALNRDDINWINVDYCIERHTVDMIEKKEDVAHIIYRQLSNSISTLLHNQMMTSIEADMYNDNYKIRSKVGVINFKKIYPSEKNYEEAMREMLFKKTYPNLGYTPRTIKGESFLNDTTT